VCSGSTAIFFKGYDGKSGTTEANTGDTNGAVFGRIAQKTGEPVVRGVVKGKQLDPDALCTMAKDDTIHVLPRILGGVGLQVRVLTPPVGGVTYCHAGEEDHSEHARADRNCILCISECLTARSDV
jgi:hypothetical protein